MWTKANGRPKHALNIFLATLKHLLYGLPPMDNPVTYIRRHVFKCETQREFAEILGTTQVTISRWEKWRRVPYNKWDMVLQAARDRNIKWKRKWRLDERQPIV